METYATLHSNEGWPVEFHVEFKDGKFYGTVESDFYTRSFLEENDPGLLKDYDSLVANIPGITAAYLDTINRWVSNYTYNSTKPFLIDEDGWLDLDEDAILDD